MDYIIVSMALSKEKIVLNLIPSSRATLGRITCFDEIDSTNRWLSDQAMQRYVHHHVCIAERQTCGVGRNGKSWRTGNSDNILMSVAHQFDLPLAKLSGLSLAAGIAIVNALESLGVEQLSLKWPNDVYLDCKKLAGILIQSLNRADVGPCVIIGIGLNISIDAADKKAIDQPVAELSRIGFNVDQRELIIARLIDELFIMLEQFANSGLDEYLQRWEELDRLKGRQVVLNQDDKKSFGRYLGVNRLGAVRIELENQTIEEYYVGDLSIRAVE